MKKHQQDRQSQELKIPTQKPRDEPHQYRSRSLYIRKEGSSSELNSANYASSSEDHPSPGGLRMSIDYGNPMEANPRLLVDHLPQGEMEVFLNQPHAKTHNFLDPSSASSVPRMAANGGATGSNVPNVANMPNDATSFSLRGSIRRGKNLSIREDPRGYSLQQAMNDHFDHYKKEPSLPRSNTPTRAGSSTTVASALAFADALKSRPIAQKSRNPYGTDWTPDSGVSDGMDTDESPTRSNRRCTLPNLYAAEMLASGGDSDNDVSNVRCRTGGATPIPIEVPCLSPQRTASVHVNSPTKKSGGTTGARAATPVVAGPPKRKKSLPDIQQLPKSIGGMSREEVSVLSSARREEVRKQQEDAERYRANPLLYIFSPNVKVLSILKAVTL